MFHIELADLSEVDISNTIGSLFVGIPIAIGLVQNNGAVPQNGKTKGSVLFVINAIYPFRAIFSTKSNNNPYL